MNNAFESKLKNLLLIASLTLGAAIASVSPASASVFIDAVDSTPTLIGQLNPGQTYEVTASGIADLFTSFNGGEGLNFYADGLPTYAFPAPFSQFNPDGLSYDPTGSSYPGTGGYGQGGPDILLGSLMGTFDANPTSSSEFFEIGAGATIKPTVTETLYVAIDDTAYSDNDAGYSVALTAVSAAPEPAAWAMMLLGLGGVGMAMRLSRRTPFRAVATA